MPGEAPASVAIPAAVERYGNIIFESRPVHDGDAFSRRHPPMTRLNRAKLFAPFAALVGFEERVQGKQNRYVSRHELDADEEWALNRALQRLAEDVRLPLPDRQRVRVEYFEICADPESDAYQREGTYQTADGVGLRVDPHGQRLTLLCGASARALPFADIYRITIPAG